MKLSIKVERLVEARVKSGVSLADLAEIIGVSPSTLSSLENGHHEPSQLLFNAVRLALAVNPRWIDHGEPPLFIDRDVMRHKFAQFMGSNVSFVDLGGAVTFTPKGDKIDVALSQQEVSIAAVKIAPQLPDLLKRLAKHTSVRGKKSELAAFIERATGKAVSISSVMRWLAGENEPGGEAALLMLKWVELQERKI